MTEVSKARLHAFNERITANLVATIFLTYEKCELSQCITDDLVVIAVTDCHVIITSDILNLFAGLAGQYSVSQDSSEFMILETQSVVIECHYTQLFFLWCSSGVFESDYNVMKGMSDLSDGVSVTQREPSFTQTEGKYVTLTCTYTGNVYYLFWYRQSRGRKPEFAVRAFETSDAEFKKDFAQKRFSSTVQQSDKLYRSTISDLLLSDTAVYYCAASFTLMRKSDSIVQ
ncbi:uncharacterized protein LOC109934712 [Rhincodon typus]|uniref:uncharacterized protein LOC109934712 n=1 Tax=Rhincodon typus TaxID=259920 RepID=UPI00203099B7|nr:uncharacterized protein LOC109934712 [Rhincodon typus]